VRDRCLPNTDLFGQLCLGKLILLTKVTNSTTNSSVRTLADVLIKFRHVISESSMASIMNQVKIFAMVFFLACGSNDPDVTLMTKTIDENLHESSEMREQEFPIAVSINPGEGLEDMAIQVAEAWSNVLQQEVLINETGVQFEYVEDADAWQPCIVDGKPYSCLPNGFWKDGKVYIRRLGKCPTRTMAHEYGHVLGYAHFPAPSIMQTPAPKDCDQWNGIIMPEEITPSDAT
jgi:predicted Zn-dependent protease